MNGDGVSEPVSDRDEGLPATVARLLEDVHAPVSLLFRAGLALDSSTGSAESATARAKSADGLAAVDAALLHTQSMTTALSGLAPGIRLGQRRPPPPWRLHDDTGQPLRGQTDREQRLALAFVALADTLVTDFDVADLFTDLADACTDVLDVTAAGLMLADAHGQLRVMASSSERSRLLELMEIQNNEGPCLDAHRTGAPVLVPDLTERRDQWPQFAEEALSVGFRAAYAIPMRVREHSVGALNLFHRDTHALDPGTVRVAQALADVATIAIVQNRAAQRHEDLSQQLQAALNSRVVIEQAKGMVAEQDHTDMDSAFRLLRSYARRTNQRLSDIAHSVVTGQLNTRHLQDDSGTDPPPHI